MVRGANREVEPVDGQGEAKMGSEQVKTTGTFTDRATKKYEIMIFFSYRYSKVTGAIREFIEVFMVVVSEWERDKRRGEEENGVLSVVWVSPEVAIVMADGRAAKEGKQTKALAMPLIEVN
uniref:Uncharacterized protein n=1 Tax=Solanum tuberosum TaxID=4113 RepID=M1DJB8_SOLTU